MVEQSRIFDEAPEIAKEAAAAASLAKELAVALTEDALEAIKQVCGLLQLSPEFCRFAKLEYLRDYAFLTHYGKAKMRLRTQFSPKDWNISETMHFRPFTDLGSLIGNTGCD